VIAAVFRVFIEPVGLVSAGYQPHSDHRYTPSMLSEKGLLCLLEAPPSGYELAEQTEGLAAILRHRLLAVDVDAEPALGEMALDDASLDQRIDG
jgi:hypothetical protein